MTIAAPFAAKTASVSTITAAEINAASVAHASAIDGVGGSDGTPYAPSTVIEIGGDGLKLSETTGAAANLQLASRSVTRHHCQPYLVDTGEWTVLQGAMASNVSQGTYIYVPLDLPHGATLTSVVVYLHPAGAHGALPANMPKIRVSRVGIGGTETVIGAETADGSALVVTYEAAHAISVSGLSEVIDRSASRYLVRLQAESGANFIAGCKFITALSVCTVTSYTEY
jgi:hypothetical protein